jgi:hypothetical protein
MGMLAQCLAQLFDATTLLQLPSFLSFYVSPEAPTLSSQTNAPLIFKRKVV